ncbi:hypothetical protein PISL3812_07593 [Talaromyces islandicus]|uniref:Uncharacterized protein n=1 Tax=Talaromyces islandicus TaxID=28573 RepID=A0A0U1M4N7_TALIS|nr:hypothetical protein PISL3812_07593 [Talaromyces islandicus]
MTSYIHDTTWLLASFSLLTATISAIIKPTRQTFIEGAKYNTLCFSPIRSGTVVLGFAIYLIHLRLSNTAEIHTGLKLYSRLYIPSESSEIRRGFWPSFARRAFLIGGTLLLYAALLAWTSYRWLHIFTTCLVAEAVLAEVLIFYRDSSTDRFTLRINWPHYTLLIAEPFLKPGHSVHDHVGNASGTNGIVERKGDGHTATPSKDNLCDRIQQLWPTEPDLDITFAVHSIPPEHEPTLEKIFSPHVRYSRWTCGHWRCLVYTVSRALIRIISFSWYLEQISVAWLLHIDLQPVTLRVSDMVLGNNLLGGILTMVYQISLLLTLFASGFIFSLALIIRLRKQERIKRAFQEVAETAPITYKALDMVFGRQLMPSILGYLVTRGLFPNDPSLTREVVSYAIEIVVILIIYITGYRLLFSSPRSENTELPSTSSPLLEPSMSPGLLGPATTATDNNKEAGDKSKYSYILPSPRFQIFRLAIWIPAVTLAIFVMTDAIR